MRRLRRYDGVDSAAQTLVATETVTMSLATTKVDCTQTWHVTRWTHEHQILEIQSVNRAQPTWLVWKSGCFTASLDGRNLTYAKLRYLIPVTR